MGRCASALSPAAERPWRFTLLAPGLLLAGAAALAVLVGQLLASAGGMSAFLLRVSLLLAALAYLGHFWRVSSSPAGLSGDGARILSLVMLAPPLADSPAAWTALYVVDGLAALIAAVDLFTLPARSTFAVDRETGRVASLRQAHPVQLIVSNQSPRSYFVWIRDGVPEELRAEPQEFRLLLAPRSRAIAQYQARSVRRGALRTLDGPPARPQPAGTLAATARLQSFVGHPRLSRYEAAFGSTPLLARTNRLNLLGVRRTRRIGQDNDFERLRDYTPDDNYKHIDWRAPPVGKADGQGFSEQSKPAADLPAGLRPHDDQPGGRLEPAGPFAQRHADAQLRGVVGRAIPSDCSASPTRSTASCRRRAAWPDEPAAARFV